MREKLFRLFKKFWVPGQKGWGRVRWPLMSIVVGLVAGLGAIFFEELLRLTFHYFLQQPTGYVEPMMGAKAATVTALGAVRSWLFLAIPALGGLVSGILVYSIAPEAQGEGTDAMIESFHEGGGFIRPRVPFIKIIASAIVIGSGGSAGKEGPISQIGSGFGSIMATLMKLKPRDRRILVLAGAAGGLGAIFHAPLGAALFAPEVLYRETEFEYEAILPCIISSIVASSIFDQYFGRSALFFPGPVDFAPVELLPYVIFGVVCALAGYVWVKTFHNVVHDQIFGRLNIPRILKPALGGLLLGAVALHFPQVMDGGYGWIQAAMEGKIFWGIMFLLFLMKVLGTSLTIGSGGSGGVFGPSVFMGAMLGGAFGFMGHHFAPGWVINPQSFVLVGIGGFFAGVAKVPVAAIIMACEMCASYTLLVPLMIVSTISVLLLGKVNLYEKQVAGRLASPAHLPRFARGLLEKLFVKDAVTLKAVTVIPENLSFPDLVKLVTTSSDMYYPVMDESGNLTGILSVNDIREIIFEPSVSHLILAKDVATSDVSRVFPDDTLQDAMDKMSRTVTDELPVVRKDNPNKIIGMISKKDIIGYYHETSRK
jgi:CIC family chloride channel protein